MVGLIEGMLVRSYGYPIFDSVVIGRGHSNGGVKESPTFRRDLLLRFVSRFIRVTRLVLKLAYLLWNGF